MKLAPKVPWEAQKKILEKKIMPGNCPFSCKINLVNVLSGNGEKTMDLLLCLFCFVWVFLKFAGICLFYNDLREGTFLIEITISK